MAGVATHALVADSYVGQFIIAKGDPYSMEKAYKEWHTKLFKKPLFGRSKLIELPTPNGLPAVFRQEMFLALSVVEIPQQHVQAAQQLKDPRMANFLDKAGQVQQEAATEKPGVDILDEGFQR